MPRPLDLLFSDGGTDGGFVTVNPNLNQNPGLFFACMHACMLYVLSRLCITQEQIWTHFARESCM